MSERVKNVEVAFTTKKQSAYGTENIDGDLTLSHLMEAPDIADRVPEVMPDDDRVGYNHEFSENQEIESWEVTRAFKFNLTSLMAGWIGAFGLGSVVTTQPDVGESPNTYDHTCKWSTAASKQNPVTTFVEKVSTGIKRKIPDLAVATFEISGEGKQRIQGSVELVGSGRSEASTLTMPASVNQGGSFLRMRGVNFQIGPSASEIDVSSRLKSWSWTGDLDLQLDDGYFPGSGLFRGRCEWGVRKSDLTFTLLLDSGSQEIDDLEANNYLKLILLIQGDLIEDTYYHQATLTLPRISYRAVQVGEEGPFLVYNVECNIHNDSVSGYPIEWVVRNDQPTYLV